MAYLPAIQSFLDVADEVIVIDGGSADESLERLKGLHGREKLKIVSSEFSFWGNNDSWEWPQIAINRQHGFDLCKGDWAIHFDADYVLPDFEQEALLRELDYYKEKDVLCAFNVIGFNNGRYIKTNVKRFWCVNKKLAFERQINLVYGLNSKSGGLDNPIMPERQAYFIDPINKQQKNYYLGQKFAHQHSAILNVNLYRYGHFFFSSEQLLYKEQRLENALARYHKRTPAIIHADRTPYKRIDVEYFLKNNRHPKTIEKFLKEFPTFDIIGLRDYEYNWVRKLSGFYRRLHKKFKKSLLMRIWK